jgi:hypothetical protein
VHDVDGESEPQHHVYGADGEGGGLRGGVDEEAGAVEERHDASIIGYGLTTYQSGSGSWSGQKGVDRGHAPETRRLTRATT